MLNPQEVQTDRERARGDVAEREATAARRPFALQHRAVLEEPAEARRKLVPQAVQSSRMERRAMMIEREVQAIYRVILMKKRVGEELPGKVTGVQEHGLNVTLDSPYGETRIPIERVGDGWQRRVVAPWQTCGWPPEAIRNPTLSQLHRTMQVAAMTGLPEWPPDGPGTPPHTLAYRTGGQGMARSARRLA